MRRSKRKLWPGGLWAYPLTVCSTGHTQAQTEQATGRSAAKVQGQRI